MRGAFLLVVALSGCVADAADPPTPTGKYVSQKPLVKLDPLPEMDVCALASELPQTDVCSLLCDPTAMAARMVADGNASGTCYQLFCSLPYDQHVLVGVCLPP